MMYRLKEKPPHLYHDLNSTVLATDIPKFIKQNVDLVAHACGVEWKALPSKSINVQATWNSVSNP